MRKKIGMILRGMGLGIIIGMFFSLFFNYLFGLKEYAPSAPTFTSQFARPLDAVLVSVILWALMGLVFSAGALIFAVEKWSLRMRTIVNFLIYYLGYTPLACLAGWFPLNWKWLAFYTVIFIAAYILIWSVNSMLARREIAAINAKISSK